MRSKIPILVVSALLAGLAGLGLGVQKAAGQAPALPATAGSTPASGASLDAGAQEILASVRGLGSQTKVPLLQPPGARYQVQPGDTIDLNFTLTTQYNETVTVRPDGFISLIGAPDVHVQGQTLPEINETVKKAYVQVLHEPLVTANLKTFQDPYFVVGGEVVESGKYILHGDTTVTQAVAIAGGYADTSAKDSHVLLLRRVSNDWVQAQVLNLKQMLPKADISQDVLLQSGDLVFVPKNRLSKVRPFLPYLLPWKLITVNLSGGPYY